MQTTFGSRNQRNDPPHFAVEYRCRSSSGNIHSRRNFTSSSEYRFSTIQSSTSIFLYHYIENREEGPVFPFGNACVPVWQHLAVNFRPLLRKRNAEPDFARRLASRTSHRSRCVAGTIRTFAFFGFQRIVNAKIYLLLLALRSRSKAVARTEGPARRPGGRALAPWCDSLPHSKTGVFIVLFP